MAAKGAILFLIDQSYVGPFKVFLYTLRHALVDKRGLDLVVLTDDPIVKQDCFVVRMADKIIPVTESQIQLLRTIDSSAVSPAHRHPRYGAYWFLKFLAFDDYGYDFHIFFDADLLCTASSFSFSELVFDNRFAASPTVGRTALSLPKEQVITSEKENEVATATMRIAARSYSIGRSINSGVMYIPQSLLGRDAVEGLVRVSGEQAFRLEQDAVRFYIDSRTDVPFHSLPIWYNFPELPATAVSPQVFKSDFLPKIRILHLNLHPKPWIDATEGNIAHDYWRELQTRSADWITRVETKRPPPRGRFGRLNSWVKR